MWDLPGPGLEPVAPALAGGFPTTAPPGKPWVMFLESWCLTIGAEQRGYVTVLSMPTFSFHSF